MSQHVSPQLHVGLKCAGSYKISAPEMLVTGHVTGQIIASLALVSHAVTVTQLPVSNPEDCQLLGGRDASSVIAVSPDRGYASYIVGVPKKCPGEEV